MKVKDKRDLPDSNIINLWLPAIAICLADRHSLFFLVEISHLPLVMPQCCSTVYGHHAANPILTHLEMKMKTPSSNNETWC